MILLSNEQYLQPVRTKEEASARGRAGGIASGKARRAKKTMKQMLEICLDMKDENGVTYKELVTRGLLLGAIKGDSRNYKAIVETLGELKVFENDRKQQQLSKVEELLQQIKEESNK